MLLDTSGLHCLLHRAEPFHHRARTAYAAAPMRLTHSYVLAEFIALANARRFPGRRALTFLADLTANPDIQTVWVDQPLYAEAMELLFARSDKRYSLCDAASFILMRRHQVHDALTTPLRAGEFSQDAAGSNLTPPEPHPFALPGITPEPVERRRRAVGPAPRRGAARV